MYDFLFDLWIVGSVAWIWLLQEAALKRLDRIIHLLTDIRSNEVTAQYANP